MNERLGMSLGRFIEEYDGSPAWDTGKPQQWFVDQFAKTPPNGSVLDIGCGTGELATCVASFGNTTVGIDFVPRAIEIAESRSTNQFQNLSFLVQDAFTLSELGTTFETILDCCFFHMLDDESRTRYVRSLYDVILPGGTLYMLNFALELPSPNAPRGVTKSDIESCFKRGWSISEVGTTTTKVTFPPYELPATFAIVVRDA